MGQGGIARPPLLEAKRNKKIQAENGKCLPIYDFVAPLSNHVSRSLIRHFTAQAVSTRQNQALNNPNFKCLKNTTGGI